MNQLITLLITLTISSYAVGQSCGTKIPKEFLQWNLKTAIPHTKASLTETQAAPNVNLSLSVYSTHIVIDTLLFYSIIDSLNKAFKPTGITFTICSSEKIKESGFSTVDTKKKESSLTKMYHNLNTINVYIANQLAVDGVPVCGYAYLPSLQPMDYIFISSSCEMASTLIHEMGHFFGLLHPHENSIEDELANGTNCETAGDLICDTEASPNLQDLVSNDCEYTGSDTDANGDYYLPTVTNHMSYSRKECRCRFTPGQYQRMIDFYWSHKTHLR